MPSPTDIRPPFTTDSARAKVQAAEDAWNSRDPERVALAYTEDSEWRNRSEFLSGREEIRAFLRRKWERELDYRLKKTLWAFSDDRIAVRFEYESRDHRRPVVAQPRQRDVALRARRPDVSPVRVDQRRADRRGRPPAPLVRRR